MEQTQNMEEQIRDAQELIDILQSRQAEAAKEWEGKIAVTHLQYRKQLRAYEKEIERLNAELAKESGDGQTEPSDD